MTKLKPYFSLLIIIFLFTSISVLLYFLNSKLIKESDFYVALVTFFVGSFVIYLYIAQKAGFKRDAANILLMEVRYAENTIDRMKEGQLLLNNENKLLPVNNWSKYNYLFINDLDRDELDLINNFYNKCLLIDESLNQLSISKQLEQKSGHIHSALVKLALDLSQQNPTADPAVLIQNFNQTKILFIKMISSDGYAFLPDKPKQELLNALTNIEKITTSSPGTKLKQIANIR